MSEQTFVHHAHGAAGRPSFLGRTLDGLLHTLEHAIDAEEVASRRGWLQSLDARTKVAGLGGLIVCAVWVHSLVALVWLFVAVLVFAATSGISMRRLARQVWVGVLLFTGLIALPALFIVPGDPLWHVPGVSWTVTRQGLRAALFLLGRAEVSASFALLAILTTPWTRLLKGLRGLRVPVVLVVMLGMTHRYIYTLLQTARQLLEARTSRQLGHVCGRDRRRQLAASAGYLLERSLGLSQEIHLAMLARGYRGEVHLLDDSHPGRRDLVAGGLFIATAAIAAALTFFL
jgi:cobalt/nickel transport system permease protein